MSFLSLRVSWMIDLVCGSGTITTPKLARFSKRIISRLKTLLALVDGERMIIRTTREK